MVNVDFVEITYKDNQKAKVFNRIKDKRRKEVKGVDSMKTKKEEVDNRYQMTSTMRIRGKRPVLYPRQRLENMTGAVGTVVFGE